MTVILAVVIVFSSAFYILFLRNGKVFVNSDFGIPDYISSVDRDGDGTDDQSDILQSAREYIARKPDYKSEYYIGGYPSYEKKED